METFPRRRHAIREVGYRVDIADLLFTPERDYLVKNNGQQVKIDDLKGKTIVLCIFPLDEWIWRQGDHLDMIDAYNELLPLGDFEFISVPTRPLHSNPPFLSQDALFNHLFSALPFPTVPFSDVKACGGGVVDTFSLEDLPTYPICLPFWVVIDQTSTVVTTRFFYPILFKLFGGAELYPLSQERMSTLMAGYYSKSREQRVSEWDQLLASPTRDFLLSSNGDKVPISSLKDKVIGLYFCNNIPHPPSMKLVKKVYQEAKSRGYDFEIVQITFHYHSFHNIGGNTNSTVQQCREDISWLTLPFRDPSCRKIQRIFDCEVNIGFIFNFSRRDCLVILNPRKADNNSELLFEFSGIQILTRYGIEGYPFTRASLTALERRIQEREVRLEGLFPPGGCALIRSDSNVFHPVDASTLLGKRVLVVFAKQSLLESGFEFESMLESEYRAQSVAEESKFEVVYVLVYDRPGSDFNPFFKQLPWYVFPYRAFCLGKVYKGDLSGVSSSGVSVAAFDEDGKLIAKECGLETSWGEKEDHKLEFPFVSRDLNGFIGREVEKLCGLKMYYLWNQE